MSLIKRIAPVALVALALTVATGCGSSPDPAKTANVGMPQGTGFQLRELKDGNAKRRYSVFIPKNYDKNKKYPAILFLHGMGEGGSDGVKCTTVGLGPAIAKRASTFPFIVVFPQSGGGWTGEGNARIAISALDDAMKHYSIDPDRVILSGMSTGGLGTWEIGAKYKNRFAALVPMAGYGNEKVAPQLVGMPIWCLHNAGDPFVGVGGSRKMNQIIKSKGGNIRYTEYPTGGHNCWDAAYNGGELFAWMQQQRRAGSAAPTNVANTAGGN
jgi:predicted peptidase